MRMGMSFRMEERCEQRLSQEQRLLIRDHVHGLVLALVGAVREEDYQPVAECRKCFRKVKPAEILQGFRDTVDDFTTECPQCGHRFEPVLISFSNGSSVELPYLCGIQSLARLRHVADKEPEYIAREMPGEYRSAVIHYGTLRNAYKQIGVEYSFQEVLAWEAKVQPFLGRLPDTVIARCAGVSASVIRRRRDKAGIPAFTKRAALEEAEVEQCASV